MELSNFSPKQKLCWVDYVIPLEKQLPSPKYSTSRSSRKVKFGVLTHLPLREAAKNIIGGGCFNLAAFVSKMAIPPIFDQNVMDPPKLSHNVLDPP